MSNVEGMYSVYFIKRLSEAIQQIFYFQSSIPACQDWVTAARKPLNRER